MTRPILVLLGVAALLLAAVPAAGATAVTGAQLRSLAREAGSDPAALARLRAVTSVDGVPADLQSALAGAQGSELQRRLAALAGGTREPVDAADARREAQDVLSGSRYQPEDDGFHPLRGVLGWLGDRLAPLGRPFTWLGDHIPGGMNVVWAILGLLTLFGAAFLAQRMIRGRLVGAGSAPRAGRRSAEADPAALEHAADQAEREGDYERAVRLRFRAGLLRLARLRAISDDVSTTSGQVSRQLHSPSFDELAGTFDEVVYGGRAADKDDAAAARGRWDDVLGEARRRRRGLWIGIGLVVLVVALQVGPSIVGQDGPSQGPAGSSYSTEPDGAAAYAELLGRAGHGVQRLRDPLDQAALDPGSTLVLMDPDGPLKDEAQAVRRFVESGGRLVAAGPGARAWLGPLLEQPPTLIGDGDRVARVAAPVSEVQGVRAARSAGDVSFEDAGDLLPALVGTRYTLLGVADVGRGRIAVMADASSLQNRLLGQADNAALGLSLAGPPGRPVLFAESLHGFGPATGLDAIPGDWVWALSGLALAGIVLALSRARRLGPPERPDRELAPPRRAYAESLGRTLARTSDRGTAVESLQGHGRRLLARACGPDAPDAALRAAALRFGVEESEVDALLDPDTGRRDPLAAGRAYARLAAAASERRGEGGIA